LDKHILELNMTQRCNGYTGEFKTEGSNEHFPVLCFSISIMEVSQQNGDDVVSMDFRCPYPPVNQQFAIENGNRISCFTYYNMVISHSFW